MALLESRWKSFSLLSLIFIAALAWKNTLGHEFVYDDDTFIVRNESIRSLSPALKFFSPESSSNNAQMNGDVWRPLTTFTYALNYALAGLDPGIYHVTNVILHLVNGLLFFGLALLLIKRPAAPPGDRESPEWIAWVAAAVFLTHPVQTETVAWISQRSNLLFFFFYILSFGLFIRKEAAGTARTRFQLSALSLSSFAASLLSKEMAVSLPPVLLIYSWILDGKSVREALGKTWPYFLAAAAFAWLRSRALGHTAQTGYWAGSFVPQMLTMIKGFGLYVKLMLVPHPLSAEHLFPAKHAVDGEVALSGAVLLGILILAWKVRRREPLISFGILIFFLSLGPVSNLVPIRAIINERFLYLGTAGFGLIAATLSARLRLKGWFAPALVLIGIYGAVSARRNLDWKDSLSLAGATLRTCPQSATVNYGMGLALAAEGYPEKAAEYFEMSLRIDPDGAEILKGLGPLALRKGEWEERVDRYLQSVQKRVKLYDALAGLGMALLRAGKYPGAAKVLEIACAFEPEDLKMKANLYSAYAYGGELRKAIALSEDLLRKNPALNIARYNLGLFYESAGRTAAAKEAYREVLRRDPSHVHARARLADAGKPGAKTLPPLETQTALATEEREDGKLSYRELSQLGVDSIRRGDFAHAIHYLEKVCRMNPRDLEMKANLCVAYAGSGDVAKAIELSEAILRQNPRLAQAHFNLGLYYSSLGELNKAKAAYRAALKINPGHAAARANLSALEKERWK